MRNVIKTIYLVCVVIIIGVIYRLRIIKQIFTPIDAHIVVLLSKIEGEE